MPHNILSSKDNNEDWSRPYQKTRQNTTKFADQAGLDRDNLFEVKDDAKKTWIKNEKHGSEADSSA
jgi:hypothetical protein